jgi:cytochrome c peroxidase
MLRNIAKTAPYFHDGSVDKLIEAVQVMADVQFGERLSDQDAAAIAVLFDSLTGQVPRHFSPPEK